MAKTKAKKKWLYKTLTIDPNGIVTGEDGQDFAANNIPAVSLTQYLNERLEEEDWEIVAAGPLTILRRRLKSSQEVQESTGSPAGEREGENKAQP